VPWEAAHGTSPESRPTDPATSDVFSSDAWHQGEIGGPLEHPERLPRPVPVCAVPPQEEHTP